MTTSKEDHALVLLSGGLDSTLCLSLAVEVHGRGNVQALSLLYGQKHQKEIEAAKKIASYYASKWMLKQLPPIFADGSSTLIEGGPENPKGSYKDYEAQYGVSPTYVPFRNGNLLAAATTIALVKKCSWIYYGAHAEDAHNWAYPDCTPEFNGAMANAIYVGSYHKVRLVTPLQNMNKLQIIKAGVRDSLPFHLTWSCYDGKELACGECPTCISRIKAFKQAGVKDPVGYAIDIEWEGCRAI